MTSAGWCLARSPSRLRMARITDLVGRALDRSLRDTSAGGDVAGSAAFDEREDILAGVQDAATNAETAWAGAEVSPVAPGGDRDAKHRGDFGDGE